jgi:hypothetical protein
VTRRRSRTRLLRPGASASANSPASAQPERIASSHNHRFPRGGKEQAWFRIEVVGAGHGKHLRPRLNQSPPCPSPLERLAVARVAACWLQTAYFDGINAQNRHADPVRIKSLVLLQESANRRYLAAMRTLATLRKLLPVRPARPPLPDAARFAGASATPRSSSRAWESLIDTQTNGRGLSCGWSRAA